MSYAVKVNVLFSHPKDEAAKNQWLKKKYSTVPQQYNPNFFCVPVILLMTASLMLGSSTRDSQNTCS